MAYKNVKPRIIAEEYLDDLHNYVSEDYKVYCMNGKPEYIVVFHNRFNSSKELSESVYNVKWEVHGRPHVYHVHYLTKMWEILAERIEFPEYLSLRDYLMI